MTKFDWDKVSKENRIKRAVELAKEKSDRPEDKSTKDLSIDDAIKRARQIMKAELRDVQHCSELVDIASRIVPLVKVARTLPSKGRRATRRRTRVKKASNRMLEEARLIIEYAKSNWPMK